LPTLQNGDVTGSQIQHFVSAPRICKTLTSGKKIGFDFLREVSSSIPSEVKLLKNCIMGNFVVLGDRKKQNGKGRTYSTHRKNEKYTQNFIKAEQRDKLQELDVDVRVMLNCVLKK
jgi:hypothetical protein